MNLEDCLLPSPAVVAKQLPDQVVILELESGEYYSLEGVGLLVWTLLDGKHSVQAVAEQVCLEYAVPPQQARADVLELLEELLSHRVVARA